MKDVHVGIRTLRSVRAHADGSVFEHGRSKLTLRHNASDAKHKTEPAMCPQRPARRGPAGKGW